MDLKAEDLPETFLLPFQHIDSGTNSLEIQFWVTISAFPFPTPEYLALQ